MFEFSKSELFKMLFIFIAVLISWFIFPVDSNFQPIFTSIVAVLSAVIVDRIGILKVPGLKHLREYITVLVDILKKFPYFV